MVGFTSCEFCLNKLFFKKVPYLILLPLSVLNIILIFLNGTISIASLSFGNPLLCIVNGCLGSWLLVQYCMHICDLLKKQTFITPILIWGEYSIVILCLHFLAIECIRLVDHKLFHSFLPTLSYAEGPVLTVIVMLCFSLTMPLLVHLFYWSWGLKRPLSPLYRSSKKAHPL